MTVDFSARVGGRYELIGLLGRGGMADVHRARDAVLDRQVAVKMLRNAPGAEDRERFVAEGRILANLSHPGIVTLLDIGFDEEHPFLVMQLVDGTTASDRIKEGRRDPDEVAAIGVALAEALAAAHAAGIVHRDVKPDNVLLSHDGRVLLSDFGIARLTSESARHTAPGTAVGTAAYLAPEQVNGEDVGPAGDIYSLGLVLLELLTGRRAFPGTAVEAAVARMVADPEIPDDVPVPWQRLLRRMTARDPLLRPTAADVARVLRWEDTGTTAVAVPVPVLEDDAPGVIHAARWIKIVALVSLIIMFGGGLVMGAQQVRQRAVDSGVPEVAPSLQVYLEDLHTSVAAMKSAPGVVSALDAVDRALVDRRYPAARRALRSLIAAVTAAEAGAAGDKVVESATRLLGLLPHRPASTREPTVEAPEPVERTESVAPKPIQKAEPKPQSGHGPGKAKGQDKGKGKGR
ncbi:MAG TPA: serine/threonine-protein kinase [Nocardioidaceae bacterium]|nr:serine/threonine-protein kinase [Nocardioidaceae bacterium]